MLLTESQAMRVWAVNVPTFPLGGGDSDVERRRYAFQATERGARLASDRRTPCPSVKSRPQGA